MRIFLLVSRAGQNVFFLLGAYVVLALFCMALFNLDRFLQGSDKYFLHGIRMRWLLLAGLMAWGVSGAAFLSHSVYNPGWLREAVRTIWQIYITIIDFAIPLDRALLSFARKNGVNIEQQAHRYKRIYEKPFNSEDRYMACGFRLNDQELYFIKGDPEVILEMCQSCLTSTGQVKKLDLAYLSLLKSSLDAINKKGAIGIALAYSADDLGEISKQYTFLALLQLENPLRPGAGEVKSPHNLYHPWQKLTNC